VLVRHVADTVDRAALFVERRRLADVVAIALLIAVQVGDVRRDQLSFRVVPGTGPDSIARVDGRLIARLRLA
jgi:hypothetical protein